MYVESKNKLEKVGKIHVHVHVARFRDTKKWQEN